MDRNRARVVEAWYVSGCGFTFHVELPSAFHILPLGHGVRHCLRGPFAEAKPAADTIGDPVRLERVPGQDGHGKKTFHRRKNI